MSIPLLQRSHIITTFIVLLVFVTSKINGFEIRKLDETGSSSPTDPSIKCASCSPCGSSSSSSCYSSPPPPSLPPPPPPPPKKKSPTTPYCPPPPSLPSSSGAGFVYMTAPPGQLYPVDPNYSGSSKNWVYAIKTSFLGLGLIGLLLV